VWLECSDLRLQKSVAALELLVLVLDDLDAIDNLHKTGLQLLGLSGGWSAGIHRPNLRLKQSPAAMTSCARCSMEVDIVQSHCRREGTHSISAWRASWPIFSISSLLRRGLMVRASPSSYSSSLSSMLGLSRGIMMVPLDLRLPRRGRCSVGSALVWSCSLTEEPDEVVDMSSGYEGRRMSCSAADG
jgi:hypothetical protein